MRMIIPLPLQSQLRRLEYQWLSTASATASSTSITLATTAATAATTPTTTAIVEGGSRLQELRKRLVVDPPFPLSKLSPTIKTRTDATTEDTTTTDTTTTTNTNTDTSTSIAEQLHPPSPSLDTILTHLRTLPFPTAILTDSHQRHHSYLRLSLSERCNLRCQYCMPPEGVPLQPDELLLTRSELFQLTKLFVRHGITKIRLTGGEPLLRTDLIDIVRDIRTLVDHVGMTTNGMTLSRHWESLVDAGLTHVNISLDTLQASTFQTLTRRPGLPLVLRAIEMAAKTFSTSTTTSTSTTSTTTTTTSSTGRVKINCVVMKGINDHELKDFCQLTREYPIDIRFIEWMPFFNNGWNQNRFVSYATMLESLESLQLHRIPDGPNDTTKWWKLPDSSSTTTNTTTSTQNNNVMGRIGFITSMSEHFCGSCNRLRLTADGQLKVCLFGRTEVNLRDVLRGEHFDTTANVATAMSDINNMNNNIHISNNVEDDLERLIHYAVQRKHAVLGGHDTVQGIVEANDNRPMTLIGG